jgi:hypothetical protein
MFVIFASGEDTGCSVYDRQMGLAQVTVVSLSWHMLSDIYIYRFRITRIRVTWNTGSIANFIVLVSNILLFNDMWLFCIFKEDIRFVISKVWFRFLFLLHWKQPHLNDCRLIIGGLIDNFLRAEHLSWERAFIPFVDLASSNTNLTFILKIQLSLLASDFVITDGKRERYKSDKRRKGMSD